MKQILGNTITAEAVRAAPEAEGADALHYRQTGRSSFFLSRDAAVHALDVVLLGDRKTVDCVTNHHSSPPAARGTHPEAHGDDRRARYGRQPWSIPQVELTKAELGAVAALTLGTEESIPSRGSPEKTGATPATHNDTVGALQTE